MALHSTAFYISPNRQGRKAGTLQNLGVLLPGGEQNSRAQEARRDLGESAAPLQEHRDVGAGFNTGLFAPPATWPTEHLADRAPKSRAVRPARINKPAYMSSAPSCRRCRLSIRWRFVLPSKLM